MVVALTNLAAPQELVARHSLLGGDRDRHAILVSAAGGVYVLWYLPLLLLVVFRPLMTNHFAPSSSPCGYSGVPKTAATRSPNWPVLPQAAVRRNIDEPATIALSFSREAQPSANSGNASPLGIAEVNALGCASRLNKLSTLGALLCRRLVEFLHRCQAVRPFHPHPHERPQSRSRPNCFGWQRRRLREPARHVFRPGSSGPPDRARSRRTTDRARFPLPGNPWPRPSRRVQTGLTGEDQSRSVGR